MSIRFKELSKIGYTNNVARSLALGIISKYCKHSTKDEVLAILSDLLQYPDKYKTNEIWSRLAEHFSPIMEEKQFSVYNLLDEPLAFKTYGGKFIDSLAKQQIELAMRLPVTLAGALMPDAHAGYGLPIGGVLAVENAVIPYAVGVDIGCRMSLTVFDAKADYLTRYSHQIKEALKEYTHFGMEGGLTFIMNNKIYLQIISGRGPAECFRAVDLVLEKILKHARELKLEAEVLEREQGEINRTLFSAIISLEGNKIDEIVDEWEGVIQWTAQSPYRIYHKRKNWFVGVKSFTPSELSDVDMKYITYQTLRSSGAGGQHVNKTETAVRAIHNPSGLSVIASDQRSQHQNKKLATERLLVKLSAWTEEQMMQEAQKNWDNHNSLERGNPVKVIKEPLN